MMEIYQRTQNFNISQRVVPIFKRDFPNFCKNIMSKLLV